MKRVLAVSMIVLSLTVARADAQALLPLPLTSTNAALRYWMAFAVMKDPPGATSVVSVELLDRVAAGTAPWDEAKFGRLLDDNREALDIMRRASRLTTCDWGLEYELGSFTPIEHLAKGRVLGRLNALDGRRAAVKGQWNQAVGIWLAGVRFSQHLARGGSLIAVLSAHAVLRPSLDALAVAAGQKGVDRTEMFLVIRALPEAEFDWDAAMKRETESVAIYRRDHPGAKAEMVNPVKVNQSREGARAERTRALAAMQ